tara:strand:- start:4063 stop:5325 length:1263 start_codon:yes stop_codon:yes gene_type:complete
MEKKLGIIGLGYVGLPLAVTMAKKYNTLGFDINKKRIDELNSGYDNTNELSPDQVKKYLRKSILYTYEEKELFDVNFYIITVPTPINSDKSPDLRLIISATKTVSKYLKNEDIVVFESTVYPGLTEEICIPILEKGSGLKINEDFMVGYSPERINPGDKKHTITKIKKIVSGSSKRALIEVSQVYESVIDAGIYQAESIKVAEAAKVIENTQRDINIAFVNELSIIFDKIGIDTNGVLEAAATKWNFIKFQPGLVGGHCIGVDPHYLAHKSEALGYIPNMILSGRKTNESIPNFIVKRCIKELTKRRGSFSNLNALILGATFKENCPDLRNSKVIDLFSEFAEINVNTKIFDPVSNQNQLFSLYKEKNVLSELSGSFDIIVIAVAHIQISEINIDKFLTENGIVFDVKSLFPKNKNYLRL